MKKNNIYIISIFFLLVSHLGYNQEKLNLGVIGLVHDHVNLILNYKSENVKIVGFDSPKDAVDYILEQINS